MGTFKVGFIGLGDSGEGMAENIIKNGIELVSCAHKRRAGIEAIKRAGGKEVASPKEVASTSNVIISVVRDTAQTEEILFGEKGIWETLNASTIFITCSTLSPDYCKELEVKLKEKEVKMLEAPFSGGRIGSKEGKLCFMIGGSKREFEKCLPLFNMMGKHVFHVGELGAGQALKICSKVIMQVQWDTVIEAMELAKAAGIAKESFLNVIKETTSTCWAIEKWDTYGPARKVYRETGKSTTGNVEIGRKDIHLALELADSLGIVLPFSAMTYHLDMGRQRSGY